MSRRCELQKEYYKELGNYKGDGKYSDEYVKWLEDKVLTYTDREFLKQYVQFCVLCHQKGLPLLELDVYIKNFKN